ncbi:DoxX family protein [Sphingomonas gei]|uniref:DoxX family protein n=1 Tax=Sphingomonas gei TaxID=1395960 RepID=A0A4S1XL48_9SPHN|nr:DoxX family protein [Sphingomonas gei]TGX55936.1 DoxX family protein [Sphingomonas gei]
MAFRRSRSAGFAGNSDAALLVARLVVGAFLIWGVWDEIQSSARMAEYARFLGSHGFPEPRWLALISVWAQFACGVGFVLGLATRWAGLVCAIHFAILVAVIDARLGIRAAYPATSLILVGLLFATLGAGGYAIDSRFGGSRR